MSAPAPRQRLTMGIPRLGANLTRKLTPSPVSLVAFARRSAAAMLRARTIIPRVQMARKGCAC